LIQQLAAKGAPAAPVKLVFAGVVVAKEAPEPMVRTPTVDPSSLAA